MAVYRRIAGTGSTVGAEGSGTAAPGAVSILKVQPIDATPDADGSARKRITVTFEPPDPLGTFAGVWCYLDAPDTYGGPNLADGTVAADGTAGEPGVFEPFEIGFFPYVEDVPQFSFYFKAPTGIENWRVYLIPGSERRHAPPIQAGEAGESESFQFVCLPPATPFSGREFAPLVTDVALVAYADLGWASNPLQVQGESGDQSWVVAVEWEWPENDQNYQSLGGVNIVVDDGPTQVYIGNVDKGAPARWQSQPMQLKPGTTAYTVYLISYDVKGSNNQLVDGITPSVEFNVVRSLGAAGIEYAAPVTSDGVHAFVTVTPLVGADGTSLIEVNAYWAAPSDPRFGGVRLWVSKSGGAAQQIKTGARTSPLQLHMSQPATVQTWRFYLVSVDINGNSNTIVDDLDGSLEAGETPWIDISVGTATGQLNLGKALASSFATDLAVSGGQLTLGSVSATKIVTGILQVGGGGSKVSIMKNFDTLGALIGWVGDDTGTSGFVGAWFKQLRIGGSSPSSAQITADSSGNVTISGSLIVGAVASATSATSASAVPATGVTAGTFGGGVIYAGTINTSQLNAGTISVAITLTSPTIVVTSGTITVNIDATNKVRVADSSTSVRAKLDAVGVRIDSSANSALGNFTINDLVFKNSSGNFLAALTATENSSTSGALWIYSSSSLKVFLGVTSGGDGYAQFNNGSHYALWASANKKKLVGGSAQCVGGSVTVGTGLSSIDWCTATEATSTLPDEVIGIVASGTNVVIRNLNYTSGSASTNPFVYWQAYGTA